MFITTNCCVVHFYLIFYLYIGRPSKPHISGNFTVEINKHITLRCSSNSTSAPDYYSKLVTLSYTWFVNETKIDRETRETLRLYVTRDYKYNRYSCTATEEDMESERSDQVQINLQCKYETTLYEETREWKKLFVTRNIKCNKYSCTATNRFDGIY